MVDTACKCHPNRSITFCHLPKSKHKVDLTDPMSLEVTWGRNFHIFLFTRYRQGYKESGRLDGHGLKREHLELGVSPIAINAVPVIIAACHSPELRHSPYTPNKVFISQRTHFEAPSDVSNRSAPYVLLILLFRLRYVLSVMFGFIAFK